MALGLYKPGQGYWVRVLTAVFIGILVLGGAAWGWGQGGAVRIPPKTWTLATQAGVGDANPGDAVTLMRIESDADTDRPQPFGAASVVSFTQDNAGRGTLVIDGFDNNDTRDEATDTKRIFVGDIGGAGLRAEVVGARPTPIFPQLYLQAGIASGMILLGAIGIYWWVGLGRKSGDFLIATDGEMKKVNWSTYKQIKGSTIVVIVAAFLIAGLLFLVDLGFSSLFKLINVLEA